MTIEETVFLNKISDIEKLSADGIKTTDGGFYLEQPFLNGDFTARLFVSRDGKISGSVFDNMNNEDYVALRNEVFDGAFVSTVRAEYKKVLLSFADKFCRDVGVFSGQAERVAAAILDRYGVKADFPWTDEPYNKAGVFRHADNAKWFALIMRVERGKVEKSDDNGLIDALNVKIDGSRRDEILKIDGVYPAYHMNKKSWVTIILDDAVRDDVIADLISVSYALTAKKR